MSLLMIPGPEGFLEAHYHSIPTRKNAPIVMIAPPHPDEGLLNHPVIYTLYRAFATMGFDVLRFNYRGCGKSQGTFVEGEGEILDAAFCWDWVCKNIPAASQKWVAGFSLGAWVGMQIIMRRPECQRFISLSPPTNSQDFNFLAPCPVPGLMVHGELDEVTPRESVARLVHFLSLQRRGHKIDFQIIPEADHAFTDQLPVLESCLMEYLKPHQEYESVSMARMV